MTTKILVIDNEDAIRKTVTDFLISQGFDLIRVETGNKGIEQVIDQKPNLIICNINLSDMEGFQVLKELSKNIETRFIPVILITRKSSRKIYRQAMESGADDYLSLPFTNEELLQAINTQLQKKSVIANESDAQPEDINFLREKLNDLRKKEKMQEQLLDKLYEDLRSNFSKLKLAIYMIRNEPDQQKRERYLNILEAECNWEMELLDKVSELRTLLTPENLKFLERYNFLAKLNQ